MRHQVNQVWLDASPVRGAWHAIDACGRTVTGGRAGVFRLLAYVCGLAFCSAWLCLVANAQGLDDPKSGAKLGPGHYTIAVHVSSHADRSEDPGEVAAIRSFVIERAATINARGGVKGRPLKIRFFNDDLLPEKTIENVRETLADPDVVAIVGIWSSSRGAHVVKSIGESDIPFISEMSVETLFADYPNVYTLTRSTSDEKDVFQAFARDKGLNRVAFVGTVDDLYTRTFHAQLETMAGSGVEIVSTYWLDGEVSDNVREIEFAIEDMRRTNADLIFLSIRSSPGAEFLDIAARNGVALPAFIALGSVNGIMKEPGGQAYRGALYEVAEGGIANLNNERLERLMRSSTVPGMKREWEASHIGYGARYSDLVVLAAEAANKATGETVSDVRGAIAKRLEQLREGKSSWPGLAQDWSFTAQRASAERSLIVWRPPALDASILAPFQYVRINNEMQRVPVLYVHLDMVRVFHVDSNDKSFEAEFFFTMRSESEVPIEAIEFTNAYRGSNTRDPIISVRQVHEDPREPGTNAVTRIYKVSGRFTFEPDLRKYPFDEQIFSISFQPTKTSTAFFLQPPSEAIRTQSFDVDGWSVRSHYVGTTDKIIRSVSGPLSQERVIPYYNFNYTWVMKRQVIDYILRVIVPLSCILIVAYLAVFIPRAEFNATVAIQVTALLSAIALYFALNQPEADDATLSDLIFVMSYAIISLMIALSIFEVNTTLRRLPGFVSTVYVVQVIFVPLLTFGVLGYLIASAALDGGPVDGVAQVWERVLELF